jgi:hypothetical protein
MSKQSAPSEFRDFKRPNFWQIAYSQTIAFDPLETKLVLRDLTSQNQRRSYSQITGKPNGVSGNGYSTAEEA